ncbi:MAG: cytochrome c [Betaproteobacteria bacterium]|nr:MAG: cytochrome c [Betaproteobacteria bacterium]
MITGMLVTALQAACTPAEETVPGRWYTQTQVERGRLIFAEQCARCHGENAEGTRNWREPDATGNYPPPPLNGSAHAWHHPLPVLARVIEKGGIPLGGVMPSFSGTLDRDQIRDTIAFFQDYWPDDIYARWAEVNRR